MAMTEESADNGFNIQLNMIQSLSIVGLIVSGFAQLGLRFIEKDVPNFWYVYPIWMGVLVFGTIIRILRMDQVDEHHHHHDDEDHHH